MRKKIEESIKNSISVKEAVNKTQLTYIEKAAQEIIGCLKAGGKLLIFGNGGSAADSQHIAAELVGRFKMDRKALSAIALTTDTSTLTAIANDYGYDAVFSRQVEALGAEGDVALGISTSGNSKNVIDALNKARSMGLRTIALTGDDGGKAKTVADISINVPSRDTPRIQESHIMIGHILCDLIENGVFK
jgi:D-sedoheptulose 7-phosphate isomerase